MNEITIAEKRIACAIYARSAVKYGAHGQIGRCLDTAKEHHWPLAPVSVYVDDGIGSNTVLSKRPGLSALLNSAQLQYPISYLLVDHLGRFDRLGPRRSSIISDLHKAGLRVFTCDHQVFAYDAVYSLSLDLLSDLFDGPTNLHSDTL